MTIIGHRNRIMTVFGRRNRILSKKIALLKSFVDVQLKGGGGDFRLDAIVLPEIAPPSRYQAMNRMDRIVLDPNRTYTCTRTARTGVRVTQVHQGSIVKRYSTLW